VFIGGQTLVHHHDRANPHAKRKVLSPSHISGHTSVVKAPTNGTDVSRAPITPRSSASPSLTFGWLDAIVVASFS